MSIWIVCVFVVCVSNMTWYGLTDTDFAAFVT